MDPLNVANVPLPVVLALGGAVTLGGIAYASRGSGDVIALNGALGAAMGVLAGMVAERSHRQQIASRVT